MISTCNSIPEEFFRDVLTELFDIDFNDNEYQSSLNKIKFNDLLISLSSKYLDGSLAYILGKFQKHHDYHYERNLLKLLRHDIKSYLELKNCINHIVAGYSEINSFSVNPYSSLNILRENNVITTKAKGKQNSHLKNKGNHCRYLFPISLNFEFDFIKYMDISFAYILKGSYFSNNKKLFPTILYKHGLLRYKDYESGKELFKFCNDFSKLSLKKVPTILDNYIFEQEFCHHLTLEIREYIEKLKKRITFTSSEEVLIQFTLSFIALIPLHDRRNVIRLFIKIGEDSSHGFDSEWSMKCIKWCTHMAFVFFPILEGCYDLIRFDFPLDSDSNFDVKRFIAINESKYKLKNSLRKSIYSHEYTKIQSYTCLLNTIFREISVDEVLSIKLLTEKIEFSIPQTCEQEKKADINSSDYKTSKTIKGTINHHFITTNIHTVQDKVFAILNGNAEHLFIYPELQEPKVKEDNISDTYAETYERMKEKINVKYEEFLKIRSVAAKEFSTQMNKNVYLDI